MKFTLIAASERAGGNTDQIASFIQRYVAKQYCTSDVIVLRDHHITPCGTCGGCNMRPHPCEISDDVPGIIDRMVAADALVYVAPVHGFGPSHHMQKFIERSGVGHLRFTRPLANKLGGIVVVGRRYNHMAVYNQILSNLLLNRMIVVGSGFPPLINAGVPGQAFEDTEGMAALTSMLDRMIDYWAAVGGTSWRARPRSLNEREDVTPGAIASNHNLASAMFSFQPEGGSE